MIKTGHRLNNKLQDIFNDRMRDCNVTLLLDTLQQDIFAQQRNTFKMNASFGFIVRNTESDEFRCFYIRYNRGVFGLATDPCGLHCASRHASPWNITQLHLCLKYCSVPCVSLISLSSMCASNIAQFHMCLWCHSVTNVSCCKCNSHSFTLPSFLLARTYQTVNKKRDRKWTGLTQDWKSCLCTVKGAWISPKGANPITQGSWVLTALLHRFCKQDSEKFRKTFWFFHMIANSSQIVFSRIFFIIFISIIFLQQTRFFVAQNHKR